MIESLESRLVRLEIANDRLEFAHRKLESAYRRMKLVVAAALAVMGTVMVTPMFLGPGNVTMRHLAIVDDKGRTQIALGVNDEDLAEMHLGASLYRSVLLRAGSEEASPLVLVRDRGFSPHGGEVDIIARISAGRLSLSSERKMELTASGFAFRYPNGDLRAELGRIPGGLGSMFTLFDDYGDVAFQAPRR